MPDLRSIAAPVLAACAIAAPLATAAGEAPETIPALRGWEGREGSTTLAKRPKLRFDPDEGRGVRRVVETFARDLDRAGYEGVKPLGLRGGSRRPGRGSVVFEIDRHLRGLGQEGYVLEVRRRVRVSARRPAGLFYGTRTLLQLLAQGRELPRGTARDWPRYPERGLMVDAGRKYFTPRWFRQHVRELAYLKLNYLHLHLSDNQGFRIESKSHPEIVSADHLTKRQIRRILALARRHQITVVPEIDMPGHLEAALAPHPDLQLRNVLGQPQPDKLDVTNPAARRFARDLLREYLPLFPGPYWHMGGDEYLALAVPIPLGPAEEVPYALYPSLAEFAQSRHGPEADGHDAVDDFARMVNRIVRRHGKTMRIWHDGLDLDSPGVVEVPSKVIAEWWLDLTGPDPFEVLAAGHRIMNAGWFPTYYVQGPLATIRPDMQTAYESWEPHRFYGPLVCNEQFQGPPDEVDPGDRRNLGTKLHIWNDDPEAQTEEEIARGIAMRLRVIADKAWAPGRAVGTYDRFLGRAEAIGSAPGFTEPGASPSAVDGRDCGS